MGGEEGYLIILGKTLLIPRYIWDQADVIVVVVFVVFGSSGDQVRERVQAQIKEGETAGVRG